MQPDGTYPARLNQLAASIKAWSGFVADVARVEVEENGRACRIALLPIAAGACPVEIVFNASEPRCAVRVGREIIQDWQPPTLDLVLPLLEAVTEGNVVTRRTSSAATGLPLGVSTHVRLKNGYELTLSDGAQSGSANGSASEAREHHWLPYRKPGT